MSLPIGPIRVALFKRILLQPGNPLAINAVHAYLRRCAAVGKRIHIHLRVVGQGDLVPAGAVRHFLDAVTPARAQIHRVQMPLHRAVQGALKIDQTLRLIGAE